MDYERTSAEIERQRMDEPSNFLDTAATVSSEENESAMALAALKEKVEAMYPYVCYLIKLDRQFIDRDIATH